MFRPLHTVKRGPTQVPARDDWDCELDPRCTGQTVSKTCRDGHMPMQANAALRWKRWPAASSGVDASCVAELWQTVMWKGERCKAILLRYAVDTWT
ncbi:MAG TPA: hypothetical protein VMF89_14120 [Polyangiales bacterium]|nr:hypothetical protein [Polyangiales bacterium]